MGSNVLGGFLIAVILASTAVLLVLLIRLGATGRWRASPVLTLVICSLLLPLLVLSVAIAGQLIKEAIARHEYARLNPRDQIWTYIGEDLISLIERFYEEHP